MEVIPSPEIVQLAGVVEPYRFYGNLVHEFRAEVGNESGTHHWVVKNFTYCDVSVITFNYCFKSLFEKDDFMVMFLVDKMRFKLYSGAKNDDPVF